MIDLIELLVHWEGYTDATWEDEATTQETAGDAVWAFWESRDHGRDGALNLSTNEYVPLRVKSHRRVNIAAKKAKKTTQQTQYLVEWVGYSALTWEPASHLNGDNKKIVDEYLASVAV